MTADKPTRSEDEKSPDDSLDLRRNPDAQRIIDILRQCDSTARRQKVLHASDLPGSYLDSLLAEMEQVGCIEIIPGRTDDMIRLLDGHRESNRRNQDGQDNGADTDA